MDALSAGRTRGTDPTFRTFLQHFGIIADTPTQWVVNGRPYTVHDQHGLLSAAMDSVQRVLWQRATRGRTLFQGLETGRDLEASLGPRAPCADAAHGFFRDTLQCAAVYTPQIAHLRWGKDHHCPVCHSAHADFGSIT